MTTGYQPPCRPISYTLTGHSMPGLNNNIPCPTTTIIFVHGLFTNPKQAINNYNDIATTLSSKGFVTIFSWDSNTNDIPSSNNEIHVIGKAHTAETIADQNGMKLAHLFTIMVLCCMIILIVIC